VGDRVGAEGERGGFGWREMEFREEHEAFPSTHA